MTDTMGVAIVGCGTISHAFLRNLVTFPDVRVLACADIDLDRAKAVAEQYDVPAAGGLSTALSNPDVRIVVNLTVPAAHVSVSAAAIAAGKHVYSEKPLAPDMASGARLLADAAAAGVRVAVAPDTFLAAGAQTAYQLIRQGAIGTPLSALTLLQGPGPESWHPAPEFLFQEGGGPLFDMGPYYLTALATALGPVSRVVATARQGRAERVIGSGPRAGTRFPVEVPTHVSALLDFASPGDSGGVSQRSEERIERTVGQRWSSNPTATSVYSFDSPLPRNDIFEITGTEATLAMPNPNSFDGAPRLRRVGAQEWTPVPVTGVTVGRGLGVLDLARSIRAGVPHRASGEGALHVVEVMSAIMESARRGTFVPVTTSYPPPAPLPPDWDPYVRQD